MYPSDTHTNVAWFAVSAEQSVMTAVIPSVLKKEVVS